MNSAIYIPMVIEEVKAGRPKEWRTKGDRILEMISNLIVYIFFYILFYFTLVTIVYVSVRFLSPMAIVHPSL